MTRVDHTPIPSRFLLTRLEREWRRLATRPDVLRRAAAWDQASPVSFAGLRSLDELLALSGLGRPQYADADVRAAAEERADAVLLALVLAARDDDLAARVVLQRLVPGLSAVARRRQRRDRSHLDLVDELLGAAWTAIRCYPAERRLPRYVAAQLLRDAEYQAFVRSSRRTMRQEPTEPAAFEQSVDSTLDQPDLRSELLDLVRSARRRHVSDDDVRLVAVLLDSESLEEAARRLKVSERTLRNHRAAVVHRLRQAAA